MPANPAGRSPAAGSLPYWRAMLEARWQAQLVQLTELSLEFHEAAAAVPGAPGGGPRPGRDGAAGGRAAPPGTHTVRARRLRSLACRTVAARRALADIDEALARVKPGRFGRCEQCAGAIPLATLTRTPEARFCPTCVSALDRRGAALPTKWDPTGVPVLSGTARPDRAGARKTRSAGRPGHPPGPAAGQPALA
jgi:RNA polymerase-binding transcription factor